MFVPASTLLLVLTVSAPSGTAAQQRETPKLAVMPLAAKRVKADAVEVLGDLLVNAVARAGRYEVMSSGELNAILGLEKVKETVGCDSLACAVELGGGFGADFLLTGSVGRLGQEIVISLMLVDVRHSRVEGRAQVRAADDETRYVDAIDAAIRQLFPDLPSIPSLATTAPRSTPAVATPLPILAGGDLSAKAVFEAPEEGTMQVEFLPEAPTQAWQLVETGTLAPVCKLPCKRWLKPNPRLTLRLPTDAVGGAHEIPVATYLKVVPGLAVRATARPAGGSFGLAITGISIASLGATFVLTGGPLWAASGMSSSTSTTSSSSDTLRSFGVWATVGGLVATALGVVMWIVANPHASTLDVSPATPEAETAH